MATDTLVHRDQQSKYINETPPKASKSAKPPAKADLARAKETRASDTSSALSAASASGSLDPSSTRALVIIMHGKRADDPGLREAIKELQAQGHQIAVRCTFAAGDAEALVGEAIRLNDFGDRRALTIVAAGGDGTVNEVACSLLKPGAPRGVGLAVLPLGTANDFASALGISLDPAAALRVALDPTSPRLVDVGLVNGRPFVNVALAGGVSAVPEEELSSPLKRAFGPLGIALHVIKRLLFQGMPTTPGVTIRYPLQPDATPHGDSSKHGTIKGDLLMLAAGQCRQMGRTVSVCPNAVLDDGVLDFTFVMGSLQNRAAELVTDAVSGGAKGASGGIRQISAPWLEVTALDGVKIPVNRDGEPEEAASRLLFEVLPKRLLVHMPDERLLMSAVEGAAAAGTHAARRPAPGRVRRAALRHMLRAAQPEGGDARLRARLRGAAAGAARAALVAAAGAVAGYWLSTRRGRARRAAAEEENARASPTTRRDATEALVAAL